MIHEFALEPSAVADWQSFRYFYDRFGVEHGRLISQFPKKWKLEVFKACRDTPVNRKRIEVRMASIDSKIIRLRAGQKYDPDLTWLDNAIAQHASDPFAAIIAQSNPTDHSSVLEAEGVDDSTRGWAVGRNERVKRTAGALSDVVTLLLAASKRVLFVDPYFEPTVQRYKKPLRAILSKGLRNHPGIDRIEIHTRHKTGVSRQAWELNSQKSLQDVLPSGVEVDLVRWEQRSGGEVMHARYILTDIGGVSVDHGLDEGDPGQTTDISLLSREASERWQADYDENTDHHPFDFVDRITVRSIN